MLQIIRDKTAGVVVKVLFLFLVLSFAVWGVGDYRFLQRPETPPLTIAGDAVSIDVLRQEFQRDLNRLRQNIGDIDRDVLRQFGLANQTVERVTNQSVLDRAAAKLSLVVSDNVVRQRIQEDPNFLINGAFDANAFRRLLQENGFSEARYVELMRGDAARGALVEAVTLGAGAPTTLADRLYRFREEKRRGEAVFIAIAAMPDPGAAGDADLQKTYEANAERFTEPELRNGLVVRIGLEEIRNDIQLDEAQLRTEFETRKREFTTPERRTIELIRFDDAAAAKAAKGKIDGGEDFLEVAKAAGQTPEQVRGFGQVTETSLPSDLSKPIFALGLGVASDPIATGLGTFISRVTAIEAGHEPRFEDLRARLADEAVRRAAGEAAYRTATRVEQGLNDNKSMLEAAKAAGLTAVTLEAVDAQGRERNGQPLAIFADAPEALRAFTETPLGRDSALIETRAGVYFFVRVEGITPSQRRPFATVKDDVVALWTREKRDIAARTAADEMVKAVQGGKDLASVAEPLGIKPESTPTMRRDGRVDGATARAAAAVAARLFQLKLGETATAATAEGYFVVRLAEIVPVDPAADPASLKRFSDALTQSVAGELSQQYVRALRERMNVVIDPSAVDRLYQN